VRPKVMTENESRGLAQLVSWHLHGLAGGSLEAYLRTEYLLFSCEGLSTEVIYAVEVAGGNMATGVISSVPVRWWEVREEGCRPLPMLDMRPFNAANDAGSVVWPHPIISYYAALPLVLTKEGVGPAHKRYRVFSVAQDQTTFRIVAEHRTWLLKP
jgi:hypothetical protein